MPQPRNRAIDHHRRTWTGPAEVETDTAGWVHWFNTDRLHASIGYVTPDDEQEGRGDAIRQARRDGLDQARQNRIKLPSNTTTGRAMRTRSPVAGYFHPILLTNSDTPQVCQPDTDERRFVGAVAARHVTVMTTLPRACPASMCCSPAAVSASG